jgi:hypothetical protein
MYGDANSALYSLVGIRMMMRNKGQRRPEGQEQAEQRDAFGGLPHIRNTVLVS